MQKISVKLPLEFEVTLDERQINVDINLYTKDYYDILKSLKDESKLAKLSEKEIEKYIEEANLIRDSLSEESINKLLKEMENLKALKPRIKEHLETNYKRMLECIIEDAQIEEYFDNEVEPTLKNKTIAFTMKFPEAYEKKFIKDIIIDSLELTQSNLYNTLPESDLKYFEIKSKFAPIFKLGMFTFDSEKIKIVF